MTEEQQHPASEAPRRARLARPGTNSRCAAENGFIGPLALAIMLMVAATSLTVFSTSLASIGASRESRDFLLAKENVDRGIADAALWMLENPSGGPPSLSAPTVGTGEGNTSRYTSAFTWYSEQNVVEHGVTIGGRVRSAGAAGVVNQTERRPWRSRYVGSWVADEDGQYDHVYGVAAPSTWQAAISNQHSSWVRGTVTGDWHAYGQGTITQHDGSTYTRVISYDDNADLDRQTETYTEFFRSSLSATMDERLLNERVSACGTSLYRFRPSDPRSDQSIVGGTGRCYYEINIDEPVTVTGLGVATLVSYGPIDISAPITVSPGAELHIYSRAGAVRFLNPGNNLTVGAPGAGVFVFAPNSLCKSFGGTSVTYTGSLACRAVQIDGNVTYTVPRPEAATTGRATQTIRYLESPGYADRHGS